MQEPPRPSRFERFQTIGSQSPQAGKFRLLSGWMGLILGLGLLGAVAGPVAYGAFEIWRNQDPLDSPGRSALWRRAHQDAVDHPISEQALDRRLQLAALIGGLAGLGTGAACWAGSLMHSKDPD